MQTRSLLCTVAVLMTLLAGSLQAAASETSRLTALTARQQLRDQVCRVMADGRISPHERNVILAEAKSILQPEEYMAFKQSLNRLSPPQSIKAKNASKVALQKKAASKKPPKAEVVRNPEPVLSLPPEPSEASSVAKEEARISSPPSIEVIATDHVASTNRAR